MPGIVHPLAGGLALLTIATFWLSTVLAELFAPIAVVVAVKTAIPWGLLVLIPALAATGGTGLALARGRRGGPVGTKIRRMRVIAANGVLILVPCAFYLAARAAAGDFDIAFRLVQLLELAAGATNILLLGLNLRDGLRMTRSPRATAGPR